MSTVTLKRKEDEITKRLESMLTKTNSMQSFLRRVIFKMYQDAQRQRWITEGSSEGRSWPALNDIYLSYKKKKFVDYPGAGSKMMIATGALYEATIDSPNKIVTNKSIKISVDTDKAPYAKDAAERRPIMKFGDKTINEMKSKIIAYIKGE